VGVQKVISWVGKQTALSLFFFIAVGLLGLSTWIGTAAAPHGRARVGPGTMAALIRHYKKSKFPELRQVTQENYSRIGLLTQSDRVDQRT